MVYNKTGRYFDDGKTVAFNFSDNLSPLEKAALVVVASDIVIVNGNYLSVLLPTAYHYAMLLMTDIDVEQFNYEGTFNLESFIKFAEDTLFYYDIENECESNILAEIREAIDLNIEYKTGVHRDGISVEISKLIKAFRESINNIADPQILQTLKELAGSKDFSAKALVDAYIKNEK